MQISDAGLRFIASWEGLRLQLYNDDGKPSNTSRGNCTIGVGHLVHLGPCDGRAVEAPFHSGITAGQAYDLLRLDAERFVRYANSQIRVPVSQNQFDALVDFCFNTGGGYPEVWNAVNNRGDVCAVLLRTAILPTWATEGLVERRKAECKLFNTPDEEDDMAITLVACGDSPTGYRLYALGGAFPTWITDGGAAAELIRVFGQPQGMMWAALYALGAR